MEHSGWFFGGCGSKVLAAAFPGLGIGFAGVALAFGLTVLPTAFAIGPISGCHLNPRFPWDSGKRFPVSELPAYAIAQVLGAVAGSGILYLIASGKEGFSLAGGFASNGYGAHSPGGYGLGAGTVVALLGGGDRGSGVLGLRRSSRAGIQTQRGHRVNLDAQ